MSEQVQSGFRLTPRWIVGISIAIASLIFVFSNRAETSLRFLWLELSAPTWVFLVILFAGGFLSGWLIARSRYK